MYIEVHPIMHFPSGPFLHQILGDDALSVTSCCFRLDELLLARVLVHESSVADVVSRCCSCSGLGCLRLLVWSPGIVRQAGCLLLAWAVFIGASHIRTRIKVTWDLQVCELAVWCLAIRAESAEGSVWVLVGAIRPRAVREEFADFLR